MEGTEHALRHPARGRRLAWWLLVAWLPPAAPASPLVAPAVATPPMASGVTRHTGALGLGRALLEAAGPLCVTSPDSTAAPIQPEARP